MPGPEPLFDATSTCIRPISEFNEDFGLEPSGSAPVEDSTAERKRVVLDLAYKNKVFEILVQVAKALISADDLATVLDKVMDLIFEFLPADRGFLLLEEGGALQLRDLALRFEQALDGATARRPTRARSSTWSSARRSRC